MLQHVKIANKLRIILGVNIVLLISLGGLAYFSAKSINQNLDTLFNRDFTGMGFLLEADRDLHQSLIALRTMFFSKPDSKDFAQQVKDFEENKDQADTRVGKFGPWQRMRNKNPW